MSKHAIAIEPWAAYPIEGGAPSWIAVVASKGRELRLSWSSKLGRFAKSWDAMHLRRSDPYAYREAVDLMRDFCSKVEQQPKTCLGHKSTFMGHKESVAGQGALGHSRVRAYPTGLFPSVPVSHWDRDRDNNRDIEAAGQGQASTPLRTRPSPTDTTVADRKAEHRERMAADPRFGLWAAMGSK